VITSETAPNEEATPPPSRRSGWTAKISFGLIVFAGALLAHAPGLSRGLFDPDEAAIATMGMVVARGGVLYRDVIDRKPPLAPLLYALSFLVTGSRRLEPLHLLTAAELAGAALVIAHEVRRRAGSQAAWWAAGLLIAGAIALRPNDAQAANYSQLALLPACGAIVAARRDSLRAAVLAGFLLGVATLTRQTWLIGVMPAALAAWWHSGRRVSRAVVVVAVTAATVASIGLFVPFGPFVHWTFSGNGSLLFGSSQDPFQRALVAVEFFVIGHAVLIALAIRRGWKREDFDLWLWLLTGLIAFFAGFRYFGHYWYQVLPPLCLLAAPAITSCLTYIKVGLAAIVLVPTFLFWQQAWRPIHGASNIDQRAFPLVAEVRRTTRQSDLITVWGSFPEIYWLSGRAPGGALVLSDFLVGRTAGRSDGPQRLKDATPGALHTFLTSLHEHPPKLFLDTSTGGVRKYQYYPITLIPAVAAFVQQHYRPIATIEGVTVYERVGHGPIAEGRASPPSPP
jgi:hypothetical protein